MVFTASQSLSSSSNMWHLSVNSGPHWEEGAQWWSMLLGDHKSANLKTFDVKTLLHCVYTFYIA